MKYLLDTHIVLWFLDEVEKLSKTALDIIINPDSKKYISIVSAWELAIKISIGKLNFDGGIEKFFEIVEENGFELLPLKKEHIKHIEKLPFLHRDPFDRLLIASAMPEEMSIITSDSNIHLYDVHCVW